ncbi:unnamed protein product, partial [Ixodes hexagonus]
SRSVLLEVLLTIFWWILTLIVPGKKAKSKGPQLPPGPRGLPIVGNLPFMSKCFKPDQCAKWARQYGAVLRINMGIGNVVILNDFETIKRFMSRKDMVHRPADWIITHSGILGVATLNGKAWSDNRRVCLQALRELGIGQRSMKERIRVNIVTRMRRILSQAHICNILVFLLPHAYKKVDHRLLRFERLNDHCLARFLPLASLVRSLPLTSTLTRAGAVLVFVASIWLPLDCIMSGRCRMQSLYVFQPQGTLRAQYSAHARALRVPRSDWSDAKVLLLCFTIYLHGFENRGFFPVPAVNHLLGNVLSFFVAGSTTVRSAIQWNVLYLASKPETLQLRIQREIDEVVGKDRSPSWDDHEKMPLTMATIWEMSRWRTDSTFGGPREITEDIIVGEFRIPKGTMILPNVRAVHTDPKLWKNPEDFDPSRFLTDDGSRLLPKPECLIPFSIGTRMCPGETFGTAEVFLYLTSIFQRFRVFPEEGADVNLTPRSQNFYVPFPQKLRFVPRSVDGATTSPCDETPHI